MSSKKFHGSYPLSETPPPVPPAPGWRPVKYLRPNGEEISKTPPSEEKPEKKTKR